jgi:hypothetical protein
MSLIILILIAVIVGYLLARSRASKPIDSAATTVADTTKDAAGKSAGWFKRTFGRKTSPKDEVIDVKAQPAAEAPAEPQPAEKQASRRKEEEPSGEPPAAA